MFEWNWYTMVALALGGFAIYVLLQGSFRGPRLGLEQRMQDFARQAVEIARSEHQFELDYSLGSIQQIDAVLEKIHLQHQKGPMEERELSRVVLTWGGYVGVVLMRRFGGTWKTDSLKAGPNTYPLQLKEEEAVPVMWCLHQIRHGSKASVARKTDELVRRIEVRNSERL